MRKVDDIKIQELNLVREQVLQEIRCAEIIPKENRDDAIKHILLELDQFSSRSWFNCKMILWENRYDSVDKDNFFKWLDTTHLRNLIDLQGGIIDEQKSP